jgi:hypothetical protein
VDKNANEATLKFSNSYLLLNLFECTWNFKTILKFVFSLGVSRKITSC